MREQKFQKVVLRGHYALGQTELIRTISVQEGISHHSARVLHQESGSDALTRAKLVEIGRRCGANPLLVVSKRYVEDKVFNRSYISRLR